MEKYHSIEAANGLLVTPGSYSSLAEAIIELIENPNVVRRVAERARETILQRHSYGAVGKNLLEIYRHVLNHPN